MKNAKRYSASFLILALLAGCSPGGAPGSAARNATTIKAPAAAGSAAPIGKGTATFTIVIPPASAIRNLEAQYISAQTKSITISVNGATPPAEADVSGCPQVGGVTTCTLSVGAPAGSNSFAAKLWSATGGAGSVLAQNTSTVNITAFQDNPFSLTLAGVISSLTLSARTSSPAIGVQQNIPLTVTAKDAGGAIIIGPYDQPIAMTEPSGIVTTLAGNGTAGFADGSGAAAQFNVPYGVAVKGSSNVYVADGNNNRIRKVTAAGVVTTLAGGFTSGGTCGGLASSYCADGTGSAAQFYVPIGVAVDGSGNVYVADYGTNRIRKVTPAGVVTTLAGNNGEGFADGSGAAAQFSAPSGVAVDGSGNVYVADYGTNRIRKVTSAGVVTTLAGNGSFGYADGPGAAAQFYAPSGVAVDSSNNVYVADTFNQRIRKVTPAGVVTTLAGNGTAGFADGSGAAAQFNYPNSVAVDSSNNVYVADLLNQRIRKVSPTGVVSTLAGNGTAGFADGFGAAAQFNYSNSVAVDGLNNVYVADSGTQRIRKITQAAGLTLPVTSLANSSTSATVNYDGSNSSGGTICAAAPTETPAPAQVCITITPAPGVTSVSVIPTSASLVSGTNTQLAATVNLIDGTTESGVSWSSSNTSVATVSQSGAVTGATPGTATISATSTRDPSKAGTSAITVVYGAVTTNPTSLAFTAPLGTAPQNFTASQPGFTSAFTASNCIQGDGSTVGANVSPPSGAGPFTVTTVKAGACTITVTGTAGGTGTLPVSITVTNVTLN